MEYKRNLRVGVDGYTNQELTLDVAGYSNINGKLGIGSIPTDSSVELYVDGDGYFTGIVTATKFFAGPTEITGGAFADDLTVNTLLVTGVSTFTGLSTFISDVYVGGTLYVDTIANFIEENINLTGIITASQLSTGSTETGINIYQDLITGPEVITIDPTTIGDNTGTVLIKGNLIVESGITTLSSNGGITTTGGDFYVGNNANISGIVTATEFVGIGSQISNITFRQLSDVDGSNLVPVGAGTTTPDYLVIYDPNTDSFRFVDPKTYFGINNDFNPDPIIVDYGSY